MSLELPDSRGYFGDFGGCFAPEILIQTLGELQDCYAALRLDSDFLQELQKNQQKIAGRATPLDFAAALTEHAGGAKIYLKREDLTQTGSHHINSTIGQAMLARRLEKTRLIAETSTGRHGVATATVASLFDMTCTVYMGLADMARETGAVRKMQELGASVNAVETGTQKLIDANAEVTRDWVGHTNASFYVVNSVVGPHPYPMMVRDFQAVIGREVQQQMEALENRQPDHLVASVGGGSNAIGLFYPFIPNNAVQMTGVEAGGLNFKPGKHAAKLAKGRIGVFQGTKTVMLQNDSGQIQDSYSVAAGLDVAVAGPEHCYLRQIGRASYTTVSDQEAMAAFTLTKELEGIQPALESAHALVCGLELAAQMEKNQIIVVNICGRADSALEPSEEIASDE